MKSRLVKLIRFMLIIALVVALGLVLRQLYNYRAADKSNAAAQELAGFAAPMASAVLPEHIEDDYDEPLPEEYAFLAELDLEALQEVNSQVLGWIYIPDTDISYPLLQDSSNYTYLSTAWDGSGSTLGSIFLECENSPKFTDFNTIIYGHNMVNGSMFGTLKSYGKQDYFDSHREIYLVTNQCVYRYTAFASYEAQIHSDTYRMHYQTEKKRNEAIATYIESSVVDCELVPTYEDYILTLSTCPGFTSYYTRWVVQAVQTGAWER